MIDDPNWRAARLEEIRAAYIDNVPASDELDAAKACVDHLRLLKSRQADALARGDNDSALAAMSRGFALWSMLAVEVVDWLPEVPGLELKISDGPSWSGKERIALRALISMTEAAWPPTHREAADPVGVLLPRWLFHRLRDALSALDEGEVQPLVLPATSRRHDDAWTWDRMRARAVEFVHFLHGQGVSIGEARERVAKASKLSVMVLRQWERDGLGKSDVANAAGKLHILLEDDPGYAEEDGNTIDAHALALCGELSSEPLRAFGLRYTERFGHRHNQ